MKLSFFLFGASVNGGYQAPRFKQLMETFKDGSALTSSGQRAQNGQLWGHPVRGNFALWSLCPTLDVPEGADNIVCDQASCAVECKGGYLIKGNPRTKCKWNPKYQIFEWRRPLGYCRTCKGEPTFKDSKIWKNCWIEPKNNRRVCKFGCIGGATLDGSSKAECKCRKKTKSCQWSMNKTYTSDWNSLKCVGGNQPQNNDGELACADKPRKCSDVTSETQILNSWSCRNCFRMRSEFRVSEHFDNRDTMTLEFSHDVQLVNFAHPMKGAMNPSGDFRKWVIQFSEEALFGDGRMDFTTEWRYFENPARLLSSKVCPCSGK